ncbi:Uncharacterized endoplasmic reticulum membrane protein [Sparassis crispa]|uniref:Uncharacterized endoplasmic reticulum membrane protein n=1 Tax=Sparassis crispa TaxID=139825 RepID=A0A401GED6_9APHY|nr:Uncharacterized endoplasmic reticulum membrane protein [Sparassis crispa]GBE80485.1 Uncharacterized endoplasmic reticulum membrane protein [Sparassis crispa]
MRGSLVCLLLAGFAQAVEVYLHPVEDLPSRLSASQAGTALSRHLGLEYFESVDANELDRQESFVGKGVWSALLITVGEEVAKDVVPSTMKPSFSLYTTPSLSSLSSLIPTYLERAQQAYSHILSQPSHPGVPRILDIFSVPSSATEAFLSETAALVDFLESETTTDSFAALELTGLSQIVETFGRASEQYALAAETMRGVLSNAMPKSGLKLAIVTVPTALLKRQDENDGAQPPQSPLPVPSPGPAEPISGVSTCYTSAESCVDGTGACSGHGECVRASKAGKTCYVCACAATKDDGGRTENWAGSACERLDVSGPFVLLTGTVVTLALLVGGSIALLSGIGGEELPSVLTGGIVPTTRD